MRRRIASACAALTSATVLAVAGCSAPDTENGSDGGGSQPGKLDGGLLDRAPERPTEPARERSGPGAVTFATYVFEILTYAYSRSDPAPVETIADLETCFGCEQPLADIASAAQDDRVLIGPTPTVTSGGEVVDETGDRVTVRLTVQQPDLVSLDVATGEPTGDDVAAVDGPMLVTLRWDATRWTLVDFAPVGN